MQQALYGIADQRAQQASDPALQAFVSEASTRVLRSVEKREIATFIGLFGSACKERFNASLDDREVTIYNNAVRQRHKVTHERGGTMTFKELSGVITAANIILDSAEKALTP